MTNGDGSTGCAFGKVPTNGVGAGCGVGMLVGVGSTSMALLSDSVHSVGGPASSSAKVAGRGWFEGIRPPFTLFDLRVGELGANGGA